MIPNRVVASTAPAETMQHLLGAGPLANHVQLGSISQGRDTAIAIHVRLGSISLSLGRALAIHVRLGHLVVWGKNIAIHVWLGRISPRPGRATVCLVAQGYQGGNLPV